MLVIFAVIIGGIIAGRLLSSWRLVFVSRMITVIIWLLLFLLGLEVGSDPAVVGGMATLGRTAFVIFACSVAGSICMSWLLWRCVRRGTASRPPAEGMPEQAGAVAAGIEAPQPRVTTSAGTGMPGPAVAVECPGQNAGRVAGEHVVSGADAALSMWGALRGSLVIVAFFVAGCLAGLSSALPFDVAGSFNKFLILTAAQLYHCGRIASCTNNIAVIFDWLAVKLNQTTFFTLAQRQMYSSVVFYLFLIRHVLCHCRHIVKCNDLGSCQRCLA